MAAPETFGGNEQVDRIAATLDGSQESSLQDLEVVIERGLKTFLEVGTALLSIRELRLYREQGYATFEDYRRQRWQMSRVHAHHLIAASGVVDNLLTSVNSPHIPQTERQARELTRLTPDQQRTVAAQVDFQTATAVDIRAKVDTISLPLPKAAKAKVENAAKKFSIEKAVDHFNDWLEERLIRCEDDDKRKEFALLYAFRPARSLDG
jgi:hypothetical protein